MQRLLARLRKQLEDFVEQRDDLIRLVACGENDTALVLASLRDMEQSAGTDVYLIFRDPFVQPYPFVDVIVERLKEERRMACEALKEAGRGLLPELPAAVTDGSRPPAERLQEAIAFARSLVPSEGGHRLVWVMFPDEVRDWPGYLSLVSALAPWHGIQPWMRGTRIIARYRQGSAEAVHLREAPRASVAEVDLGPAAMEASFREEAEDESLPDEQRMQSLLSLAYLDYAHNRSQEALAKFDLLLGYYQANGNQKMQAFVMSGIAEAYNRRGDIDQAQHWYECATMPAAEAKDPMILGTLARKLGEAAFTRHEYARAEEYFDGWDKVAAYTLDSESKARALELKGVCAEKQGAFDRAIGSWAAALTLSRSVGMTASVRANLEHLARVYRERGMRQQLAEVEREMRSITPAGAS